MLKGNNITGAASVRESTAPSQGAGPGSTPRAALQQIQVRPISLMIARKLIKQFHYLHSMPGATCLAFGIFFQGRLAGALTLGVGPFNSPALVKEATGSDYLALTRFWLSNELPPNSESWVLGLAIRFLRRETSLKFLLTYADPAQGHLGIIYQATNWI